MTTKPIINHTEIFDITPRVYSLKFTVNTQSDVNSLLSDIRSYLDHLQSDRAFNEIDSIESALISLESILTNHYLDQVENI